jgi:hypothetical protein
MNAGMWNCGVDANATWRTIGGGVDASVVR